MKSSVLHYFHAYGKVCLTISAHRVFRSPPTSTYITSLATMYPPPDTISTQMWVVGMALCLPANRDSGTKRRGRTVANDRAFACMEKVGPFIDKLPIEQLTWDGPIDDPAWSTTGQFLMNEEALEALVHNLGRLEAKSHLAVNTLSNLIDHAQAAGKFVTWTYPTEPNPLVNELRRIRKLAAANDGSAGLYKAYKKVFNTGKL